MLNYIFLPDINFSNLTILPAYKDWLDKWFFNMEVRIDEERISSSMCIQGILSELSLKGKLEYDWGNIIKKYLIDDQMMPIAYSKKFGENLYKFNFWYQTPIHAIYMQWWIDKHLCLKLRSKNHYGDFIKSFIQNNRWIYNPSISPTQIKTRMKSELLMSMAMGIEILADQNLIDKNLKMKFESTLSSYAMTGYLSAEYFRLKALSILNSNELAPSKVTDTLTICGTGTGYCDFSISSKFDDYMGVAKRTARDQAVPSAISSIHALYLANKYGGNSKKITDEELINFSKRLQSNPFDIPAFKMRDINYPFGTDLTPFELLCASKIIKDYRNR